MKTIHARQRQFAKIHIRKTTSSEKALYVVSNIFSHHILHTPFTPVLRFSPLYHQSVIYINSTNIPPIMIINRIYEHQNLLSL
jgi:hypothetical protein